MARTHEGRSQHRAARDVGEPWGTAGLFVGQSQPWWVAKDLGGSGTTFVGRNGHGVSSHLQLGQSLPWWGQGALEVQDTQSGQQKSWSCGMPVPAESVCTIQSRGADWNLTCEPCKAQDTIPRLATWRLHGHHQLRGKERRRQWYGCSDYW